MLAVIAREIGNRYKLKEAKGGIMRKQLIFGLILVLIFGLSTGAVADQVSQTIVSNDNAVFCYFGPDGNTYPVVRQTGLPTGWNSDPDFDVTLWTPAVEWTHNAWFLESTSPFDGIAKWISPSTSNGAGPDFFTADGYRGVYGYRTTFKVPATAYNLSGSAGLGSDNYGWLDINGIEVLSPYDSTQDDRNFCIPPSQEAIPTGITFGCQNVLAAEVQNGVSIDHNNSTGVIFIVTIKYKLPDVIWQPPVTNQDDFPLKDGTTLPLKFKLFKQDGTLITDEMDVYMTVHQGINTGGALIDAWHLGDGIDYLRFDYTEYHYIANFHTKNYELIDGQTYTAFVHDGCTGDVLGSVDFTISTSTGTGRGKQ